MRHILIISIGPIQDFIAAARRCRDLWYGSWLLSELSKATARGVATEVGIENLVFPGASPSELEPASNASVANKIVVVVPEGKDPEIVADAGKRAMADRRDALAADVFKVIENDEKKNGLDSFLQREIAVTQIQDLIEFLWVAAPFDGETSYAAARKQAEELLAGRKRTMLWPSVPWKQAPGVPKSSLDGQRESVVSEDLFDFVKKNPHIEGRLRRTYGVKTNERLCGVGILKRLGEREGRKDHKFLSTPYLASMPLLQRMRETDKREIVVPAWKEYLGELEALGAHLEETAARRDIVLDHYDGQLLFETRLEEWFDDLPKDDRQEAVKKAQRALGRFFETTNLPRPLPYFAVLLADGDNMGKAIAHRDSEDAHQSLSKALDRFARNAKDVVEKMHDGELIYSGGDDVLAFVPLNRAIECAQKLAGDFARDLEAFRHSEGQPTLSVGIAICHFMDPMGDAFELARLAEKKAKVHRNSLAMIVDKRSGPPTVVSGHWGTVDEHVLLFAEWHRKDDIPDGVAFELQELNTLRVGAKEGDRGSLEALIRKETARILGRKRKQRGEMELDGEILRKLLDVPQELSERLIVARLIAQAKDIAEGPRAKEGT